MTAISLAFSAQTYRSVTTPTCRHVGTLLRWQDSLRKAARGERAHLGEALQRSVARVRDLAAPLGARPVAAEVVGLVPAAALAGYPAEVPIRGFDPDLQTIEARLPAAS